MPNFTEGEWIVSPRDCAIETETELIAEVCPCRTEYKANVRLMAQSKKMYEALSEILNNDNIEVCPRNITSSVHGPDMELWFARVRAILSEIDKE